MTIIRIISQCRRNQGFIYIIYIVYLEFSVNSLIIYNDTIDHSRANSYNIIQFTFNKLDHVFSYLVCISPYTKWSANSSKLAWKKNMAYLCTVCFSNETNFLACYHFLHEFPPLSLSLPPFFFFSLFGFELYELSKIRSLARSKGAILPPIAIRDINFFFRTKYGFGFFSMGYASPPVTLVSLPLLYRTMNS